MSHPTATAASGPGTWVTWGRVLRLSLGPSAPADAAAGIVLGAAGVWPSGPAPWLLLLASSLVYHGGMALNDWADREEDARVRPDRPIPSGRLRASRVLAVAGALLVAGPLLASFAHARAAVLVALVAACAVLYDLIGRGPWRGPILLGACRAGNLGAGLTLGLASSGGAFDVRTFGVCALYGGYVFSVSRLGRMEDVPAETRLGRAPSLWTLAAGLCLVALPFFWMLGARLFEGAPAVAPRLAYYAAAGGLALWGALPLLARAGRAQWSPHEVLPVMGIALRRLLVFTAACALLAATPSAAVVALLIFGGYPASYALRRLFPPS